MMKEKIYNLYLSEDERVDLLYAVNFVLVEVADSFSEEDKNNFRQLQISLENLVGAKK